MTLQAIKQSIKQTPFFECEDGLLYCADCMDILPQLPEGCVDLCWRYATGSATGKQTLLRTARSGWATSRTGRLKRYLRSMIGRGER